MFWKIKFDEGASGFGFVQFDENMVAIGLFDIDGKAITTAVGYTPVQFDVTPNWS